MVTYVPTHRPVATGVWLLDHETDDLTYVDTHDDSLVTTQWPTDTLDNHEIYHINKGADYLLNAAAQGKDKLDQALRVRWIGDPSGLLVDEPYQSNFWYRHIASFGSVGAQARLFIGDGVEGSKLGLIVDDTHDGLSVTGYPGGLAPAAQNNLGRDGQGPGGGKLSPLRLGGGGGGFGTAGSKHPSHASSGEGGPVVPHQWCYIGVIHEQFYRRKLADGRQWRWWWRNRRRGWWCWRTWIGAYLISRSNY